MDASVNHSAGFRAGEKTIEAQCVCLCIIVGGGQSLTGSGCSSKLSGADDIVSSAIVHRDREPQMRAATLAPVITIKCCRY